MLNSEGIGEQSAESKISAWDIGWWDLSAVFRSWTLKLFSVTV